MGHHIKNRNVRTDITFLKIESGTTNRTKEVLFYEYIIMKYEFTLLARRQPCFTSKRMYVLNYNSTYWIQCFN